jgi:hypothetical protein
MNFNNGSLI